MATATTAEITKVVRQMLNEELGDDSETMLKGIQRVTRLLTDEVIPKLDDDTDTEEPPPTSPSALRGTRSPRGTLGKPPTPNGSGHPERPTPEEHLRQDKLYIKDNEGILHEVKISPAAYRRDVPCSCP
jgi:hypothetical protein